MAKKQSIEIYDYSLTQEIEKLRKEKMSVSQIAFSLNLDYLELKNYLTNLAIDQKASTGNITAIQIQMKREDSHNFETIKNDVWNLKAPN